METQQLSSQSIQPNYYRIGLVLKCVVCAQYADWAWPTCLLYCVSASCWLAACPQQDPNKQISNKSGNSLQSFITTYGSRKEFVKFLLQLGADLELMNRSLCFQSVIVISTSSISLITFTDVQTQSLVPHCNSIFITFCVPCYNKMQSLRKI